MIIVLRPDSTAGQIDHVLDRIQRAGLQAASEPRRAPHHHRRHRRREQAAGRAAPGHPRRRAGPADPEAVQARQPRVPQARHVSYQVGQVKIGGGIAGHDRRALRRRELRGPGRRSPARRRPAGANILRGGAFKPRTSPYSFQGLGEDGLKILRDVGEKYDMPVVTEVMDPRQVELVVALRRHVPDRRPQHAELRSAQGSRPDRRSRCCSSAA